MSPDETKAQFKRRQVEDEQRKRMLLAELEEVDDYDMYNDEDEDMTEEAYDGMPDWTNSDGDRLRDFGVDEDSDPASGDDDEDVPLAELMRRRKVLRKDGDED